VNSDEAVYIGGLMVCCLLTLDERTEPASDGEVQPCKYCRSGAEFTEQKIPDRPNARGAWRWVGHCDFPKPERVT